MKRSLVKSIKRASAIASVVAVVLLTGVVKAGADSPRVLVIPFSTINVPESQQWMSQGVEESLVADFGRSGGYSPVAFQGKIVVEDNATAARLAQQASTTLVVRGAAQVVGTEVRLTAQLIDAKSGNTLTTASATGPASDLLKLEDEISAQLRGVAGPAAGPPAQGGTAAPAGAVLQAGGAQAPGVPQIIVIEPQAASAGYSTAAPYYSEPYYYDPYGYLGFGTIYPGFISSVVLAPNCFHHGQVNHGGDFRLARSTGPSSTVNTSLVLPTTAGGSFGPNLLKAPLPQLPSMIPNAAHFGARQGH